MPSVGNAPGGAAGGSGPSLQLLAPAGAVQTGVVRFSARSTGTLEKVTFFLDDKAVLTKRTPPYSVELNLGNTPSPHRVRVVGYQRHRTRWRPISSGSTRARSGSACA